MPKRDVTHRLTLCLTRAIGWGMVALGVADFGSRSALIVKAARHFWFCVPTETCGCGFKAPIWSTARIVEGTIVLACGIVVIRSPRLLFRACSLATAVTIIRSSLEFGDSLKYLANEGAEVWIAWMTEFFVEPIIGLAMIMSLYPIRRVLKLEQDAPPLCQVCGYDLRGSEKLTCAECGCRYSPKEFYKLNQRGSVFLMRALVWGMIAFGAADVGARFDIIVNGRDYLVASYSDGAFDNTAALPYLQTAALAQIVEGAIVLVCGVVAIRSPKLLFRVCTLAVLVAILLSTVEYIGTLRYMSTMSIGHQLPSQVGWFSQAFLASFVGLFVITALYPVRRLLGLPQDQSPVCQNCGSDLREIENLCCSRCGRSYTPFEFFQL